MGSPSNDDDDDDENNDEEPERAVSGTHLVCESLVVLFVEKMPKC